MSLHLAIWAKQILDPSPAEMAIEVGLASIGKVYRAQHPVGGYFIDFAFPSYKIAVEIDDDSHLRPERKVRDRERDAWLRERGWVIIRLKDKRAVANPLEAKALVLEAMDGREENVFWWVELKEARKERKAKRSSRRRVKRPRASNFRGNRKVSHNGA